MGALQTTGYRATCIRVRGVSLDFLRTSEVARCGFRGTVERCSPLLSMMENGYKDGTRIL